MRAAFEIRKWVAESGTPIVDKGIQGGQCPAAGQFKFVKALLVQVLHQFVIHVVLDGKIGFQQIEAGFLLHQFVQVLGEAGGMVQRQPHVDIEHLQRDFRQAPVAAQAVVQVS